jgi:hypothetical protein
VGLARLREEAGLAEEPEGKPSDVPSEKVGKGNNPVLEPDPELDTDEV